MTPHHYDVMKIKETFFCFFVKISFFGSHFVFLLQNKIECRKTIFCPQKDSVSRPKRMKSECCQTLKKAKWQPWKKVFESNFCRSKNSAPLVACLKFPGRENKFENNVRQR